MVDTSGPYWKQLCVSWSWQSHYVAHPSLDEGWCSHRAAVSFSRLRRQSHGLACKAFESRRGTRVVHCEIWLSAPRIFKFHIPLVDPPCSQPCRRPSNQQAAEAATVPVACSRTEHRATILWSQTLETSSSIPQARRRKQLIRGTHS